MPRLFSIFLFLGSVALLGSALARPQPNEILPITIDELTTRNAKHGVVRLITNPLYIYNSFPKDFEGSTFIQIEFWNFERTEFFSSLRIDNNMVVDQSIRGDLTPDNYLRSWDLNDMDDFYINSFDVKNERVEIQMTLYPSRIPDVIKTHCVSAISGKNLGPLNCKQVEAQP